MTLDCRTGRAALLTHPVMLEEETVTLTCTVLGTWSVALTTVDNTTLLLSRMRKIKIKIIIKQNQFRHFRDCCEIPAWLNATIIAKSGL